MEMFLHFVHPLMAWRVIKHRKDLAYVSWSGNGVCVTARWHFAFCNLLLVNRLVNVLVGRGEWLTGGIHYSW